MIRSSSQSEVNVPVLMREIRKRVRGENRDLEWIRQARRSVPGHLSSTVGRLRASTAGLRSAVGRIGEPPPAPPTLRARLGAFLVFVIQRALFWYTPTVKNANSQIIDALETHLKVTEEILAILERTNIEIARISGPAAQGEARNA